MTGKPRGDQPRQGTCDSCGEKTPLVRRADGWVCGFHHGDRQGIGAGCRGVGYPSKGKS